jgi:surface antigen
MAGTSIRMRKPTKVFFGSVSMAFVLMFSAGGQANAEDYLQCVPFARMISGIEIFGDAWTWWRQAAGKYAQGFTPKSGAVLVFKPNGVMNKGHVAVVSQVLTDRVIQVTHANWSLIDGSRGQVEQDVTVVDVSSAGDWSQVKVWYDPVRDLGKTVYPTYGFIYQSTQTAARSAAENAVRTVAQTAMSQLVSAVPSPGANPAQMLGQAASSTDRIAALIQAATGGSDSH